MSLSTQLTRGTLALPMLALFGVLALVAGRSVEAHAATELPAIQVEAAAEADAHELAFAQDQVLVLAARNADAACGSHRPQLLLASAPGDLGPIAQRQGGGCRA